MEISECYKLELYFLFLMGEMVYHHTTGFMLGLVP